MVFLNALLHGLNFFAPALGVGFLTSVLVKWVWRRQLRVVSWGRLTASSCLACAVALIAGLLFFGRDGKMATYALMLLMCTASIFCFGLRRIER